MSPSFYPARKIGSSGGAELWIGSAADAADAAFCRRFGLVVNCTRNLPECPWAPCLRVPVDDDPDDNDVMERHLPGACRAIRACLRSHRHVLVHCHAGMSRSASVTAAALVSMGVGSLDAVVRRIKRVKPETFPIGPLGLPNFWPALLKFTGRCRGNFLP